MQLGRQYFHLPDLIESMHVHPPVGDRPEPSRISMSLVKFRIRC